MGSFTPEVDPARLRPIAQARVLYADTDRMGIVYHARYFRYLELARVELLRAVGMTSSELEQDALGLPLYELGVRFSSPGRYDDLMTLHIGISRVTWVRVCFQYRITVEPGDRHGLTEPVEILTAETRHCCVRNPEDGRPERFPQAVYELLKAGSIANDP